MLNPFVDFHIYVRVSYFEGAYSSDALVCRCLLWFGSLSYPKCGLNLLETLEHFWLKRLSLQLNLFRTWSSCWKRWNDDRTLNVPRLTRGGSKIWGDEMKHMKMPLNPNRPSDGRRWVSRTGNKDYRDIFDCWIILTMNDQSSWFGSYCCWLGNSRWSDQPTKTVTTMQQ